MINIDDFCMYGGSEWSNNSLKDFEGRKKRRKSICPKNFNDRLKFRSLCVNVIDTMWGKQPLVPLSLIMFLSDFIKSFEIQ